MRFTEEEKLTIIAEGEKNGVRAVCARYGISDQIYRIWRYKAQGIKPRKHFSLKKKMKILEEVARDGTARTCAAYRISPFTYYRWRHKLGFTKLPKRGRLERFSDEEKLAILKEASQNGVSRVCAAYGIHPQTYYYWKLHKLGFTKQPRRGGPERFSEEEKLVILKEGYENGIRRTCTVYGISSQTYYSWKRSLGLCRSPRRSFRGRKNRDQRRDPQSAGRRARSTE